MTLIEAFAKVLKSTRLKTGLSQENLAFEADLSRQFISNLERGIKEPSLQTIVKLCQALKIRPSELIRRVELELKKGSR